MAGTIVNNMENETHSEADATTGWTGSPSAQTGFFRESTGCLGDKADNGSINMYDTITSKDMSNYTIHGWALFFTRMETEANAGVCIVIGDGTNRAGYWVGGEDNIGVFNVANWLCYILSVPDRNDTNSTNLAGTTSSISQSAITQVGYLLTSANKALGNIDNVFCDVLWWYDHTDYAVEISAGTSGDPAKFSDLSDYDESTATGRGLGVFYQMDPGVFQCQAPIAIGDDGTAASYFSATNEEVIFIDKPVNNYKLNALANSTGTNEIYFTGVTFRNTHSSLPVTMDLSTANLDYLQIDGCSFIGDIDLTLNTSSANRFCNNSVFDGCGQIDPNTMEFKYNTIRNSTDGATGAILLDGSGSGNWSDLSFSKDPSVAGHAIYITATGSYTLTNFTYSGYEGTSTEATIYNNSGGAVTINVSGGDTPTVRNGSGATTDVISSVDLTVTVKDLISGSVIENARVFIEAGDGTGDAPYYDSVSITRSGSVATVTGHTDHGLKTNEMVAIRGANEVEYNESAAVITYISDSSYSYTVEGTPDTPATGTITSTQVFISELTNASGVATESFGKNTGTQPYNGWVRYTGGSIKYAHYPISGDDANIGFNITANMVRDE